LGTRGDACWGMGKILYGNGASGAESRTKGKKKKNQQEKSCKNRLSTGRPQGGHMRDETPVVQPRRPEKVTEY